MRYLQGDYSDVILILGNNRQILARTTLLTTEKERCTANGVTSGCSLPHRTGGGARRAWI